MSDDAGRRNDARDALLLSSRAVIDKVFDHSKCTAYRKEGYGRGYECGGTMADCQGCGHSLCSHHWYGNANGRWGLSSTSELLSLMTNMCRDCAVLSEVERRERMIAAQKEAEHQRKLEQLRHDWPMLGLTELIRNAQAFWIGGKWKYQDALIRYVGLGQIKPYRDSMMLPELPESILVAYERDLWTHGPLRQVLKQARDKLICWTDSHKWYSLHEALRLLTGRTGAPHALLNLNRNLFGFGGYLRVDKGTPRPFHSQDASEEHAAHLFRDVFGNPFEEVPWSNAFCTSTVRALAKEIHETQTFDQLPILADALQDAGYPDGYLLRYLRDNEQIHCRGCWALELCRHGRIATEYRSTPCFSTAGPFSPLVKIVHV